MPAVATAASALRLPVDSDVDINAASITGHVDIYTVVVFNVTIDDSISFQCQDCVYLYVDLCVSVYVEYVSS